MDFSQRHRHRLSPLFNPRSIAIVGASPSRTQGVNVVLNLRASGYAGDIFPIHPSAKEFMGLAVYPSLESLPHTPDCAVFALGSDKLIPELETAGRLGIRAAIVYASGFAELDPAGSQREAHLQAIASQYGMVICGPNCMGLVDLHTKFAGYSVPVPSALTPGGVAILSHSGSGCVVLGNAKRFDISCIVSCGNSAVVDIPDYLEYLAQDEHTTMAAVLLETVRDPAAFREATLRMHEAGKPVVVLKNGRSAKGAAATAAHTGAIAGAYTIYADLFETCGVIAVEDFDELIETTVLLEALRGRRPSGQGLGVISISGGEVALACDLASTAGLELPELQASTRHAIEERMPKFAYASNPLDARTLDADGYARLTQLLADDPRIAMVAVCQDSSDTLTDAQARTYRNVAMGVAQAAGRTPKPVVFYNTISTPLHASIVEPLAQAGIPMLRGARHAMVAIAKVLHRPEVLPPDPVLRPRLPRQASWVDRLSSAEPLTEREAKRFLSDCGIRTPREVLTTQARQAGLSATAMGFPVVLKVESPDIAHKTEVGGVQLNLLHENEVATAFDAIQRSVAERAPGARITGINVQEMVQGGVEVLLGLSRHEPFGLALTVGWGGVQVELMRDAQQLLLPCDERRARRAVEKTRVHALLEGFRGAPAADKSALIHAMLTLSDIAETYGDLIEAIDINPVAVHALGKGVVALDALVITRAQAKPQPSPSPATP